MKLINTSCPICDQKNNYIVLYKANFKPNDFNIHTFSARRLPDRIHYQIVKCKIDGLVRSNPILDQSQMFNLYKKSKFSYENEINNLSQTYLDHLSPILKKLSPNARILEIGCGNGFVLEKLYKMGFKNLYGVEPSQNAIFKANKIIKKLIINDVFRPGLFKPIYFDLIFFMQTFDHIPNPNQFLRTCHKLLKPGGFIFALNHNINSFSSKILKEKSPIIDIEHPYLFSFTTISKIFKKNKFKVLNIYSPTSIITLKYFIFLLPLPIFLKNYILNHKHKLFQTILRKNIAIKLGNLCILAQKS